MSVGISNAGIVTNVGRISRSLLFVAGLIITATAAQDTSAQIAGIAGFPPPAPAWVNDIRTKQMGLASRAGIEIRFSDVGQRSETWLDKVPSDLLGPRIESEYDLFGVIEDLYPLYGFRGTETLEFHQRYELRSPHGGGERTEYAFREHIDGIPSNQVISIMVDAETKLLEYISGSLHLDRDLERIPSMSAQQAIDSAIAWVKNGPNSLYEAIAKSNLDGPHETTVVYEPWGDDRVLTPVWIVELVSSEARDGYRHVLVLPDGRAQGTDIAIYGELGASQKE